MNMCPLFSEFGRQFIQLTFIQGFSFLNTRCYLGLKVGGDDLGIKVGEDDLGIKVGEDGSSSWTVFINNGT
jgi:hypothetical protein